MARFLVVVTCYAAASYWSWRGNPWWIYPDAEEGLLAIAWLLAMGPLNNLAFIAGVDFHPLFFGLWILETIILGFVVWVKCTSHRAPGWSVILVAGWVLSGVLYYASIMSM